MKIIHQNGYTRDELQQFRPVVYRNLIDSANAIITAMRKLGVDPQEPANRVRVRPSHKLVYIPHSSTPRTRLQLV